MMTIGEVLLLILGFLLAVVILGLAALGCLMLLSCIDRAKKDLKEMGK